MQVTFENKALGQVTKSRVNFTGPRPISKYRYGLWTVSCKSGSKTVGIVTFTEEEKCTSVLGDTILYGIAWLVGHKIAQLMLCETCNPFPTKKQGIFHDCCCKHWLGVKKARQQKGCAKRGKWSGNWQLDKNTYLANTNNNGYIHERRQVTKY